MKKNSGINKKWKWIVLLTFVFLIVFTAAYSFVQKNKSYAAEGDPYLQDGEGIEITNNYTMRKREDTFSIPRTENITVKWTLSQSGFLDIDGKDKNLSGTVTSPGGSFKVKALKMGSVALSITATAANGTVLIDNRTYNINIGFSILEQFTNTDNIEMTRLFRESNASDRKVLIMTYTDNGDSSNDNDKTSLPFGSGMNKDGNLDTEELKYLNLTFGDATTNTPGLTWRSGNNDIISIDTNYNNGEGCIIAQGAGHTTLSVTWQDPNDAVTYEDEIDVFVRPKLTIDSDSIGTNESDISGTAPIPVTNGTKINVSVKKEENPLGNIGDKLIWVIAKPEGEKTVLVQDSLGNSTEVKDEASLEWMESESCYIVKAKAGMYFVQFFVVGTYKDFDTAINDPDYCRCKPVNVGKGIYVRSEFQNYNNRTIRLNIGGQFIFSEAFNITNNTFDNYFGIEIISSNQTTSEVITDDGNNIIDITKTNDGRWVLNAKRLGTVNIKVHANDEVRFSELRDVPANTDVYITVVVSDTFSLNNSDIEMSIGSEIELHPVLASGFDNEEGAEYDWRIEPDNMKNCIELTVLHPRQAIVKALKTTRSDSVNVVVYRTQNGVTVVARCKIIVNAASVNPPVPSDTHIFSDYNYNNPVTIDEAIIYGNGATLTTSGTKVNNRVFIAYTDILASYKYTVNNKGIVKASAGKVIVSITKTDTKPTVNSKNKITDTSASKIAKARIKNGQITVTAVGKEGGLVYLWVIDTGSKGAYAYCPINVKMAPKKLEVQDTSKKVLKNIKLENGKSIDIHIAGIVSDSIKTDDCTYTSIVDSKYKSYIQVNPSGDSGQQFTIKAVGLKNNKNTKTTVTFRCDQNNKKINFSLTITK